MSSFSVGDLAVGQNARWDFTRNGMDCEVVLGLEVRPYWRRDIGGEICMAPCYVVRWADGEISAALPDQLRRRPEPPNWEKLAMPAALPVAALA